MTLPKGITQRPDGLYQARVMYHGVSKTIYGRELKKLIADFEELKYQLKHGTLEEPSKISFSAYSDIWLKQLQTEGKKQTTIDSYSAMLNNHILNSIGKYRLADIRKDHIREVLSSMAELSDSTISVAYAVIQGIFKTAYEDGYITRNPAESIKQPKGKDSSKGIALTDKQLDVVLSKAEQTDIADIIKLTSLTGLRSGEVRSIKHTDIKDGVLSVQRTITNDGKLTAPKTDASYRSIPLTDEALKIVKGQKILSAKGFIFCDNNGEPITANKLSWEMEKLNKLCKEADRSFPTFSLHTLRHTYATKMANAGMIPKVLMSLLGHSNINMTMNYYAHSDIVASRKEIERIAI